jgi:hypothetical protein
MPIVLVALALGALALFVLWSRRSRTPEVTIDAKETALDEWIVAELELALAGRDGVDAKQIAKALAGDPDPHVVSTVEDAVRTVELEFLKDALDGAIDVILRVHFEDGTEKALRSRRALADLPARVRADFETKALTRSRLVWEFPWSRGTERRAFH